MTIIQPPFKPEAAPLISLATLLEEQPPQWIIPQLMPSQGVGVIYAAPGVGKTFLAITMLLSVATGQPTFGVTPLQGWAFMVATEGGYGLGRRIAAWCEHFRCDPKDIPAAVSTVPLRLLDDAAVSDFIRAAKAFARKSRVHMVSLDTLNRCINGDGDENSASDMAKAINACDRISRELQCFVWLVHHEGKNGGNGPRGSTVITGSADTILHVRRAGEGAIAVKVVKQKDAPDGQEYRFQLTPVILGQDESGADVSVPVAVFDGDDLPANNAAPARERKLGTVQAGLLQILSDKGAEGMTEKEWWDAAVLLNIARGAKPVRSFQDAKNALLEKGLALADGDKFIAR